MVSFAPRSLLPPRKAIPGTHLVGDCMCSRVDLDAVTRKIPTSCQESNPDRPTRRSVIVLTELPQLLQRVSRNVLPSTPTGNNCNLCFFYLIKLPQYPVLRVVIPYLPVIWLLKHKGKGKGKGEGEGEGEVPVLN